MTAKDIPVFTQEQVDYLAKMYPDRIVASYAYSMEDIHKMQGALSVVAHLRSLVTKQAKEKGHVLRT